MASSQQTEEQRRQQQQQNSSSNSSSSWAGALGWLAGIGALGGGLYLVGRHVAQNLPSIQQQFQGVITKQLDKEQRASELGAHASRESVDTVHRLVQSVRRMVAKHCAMNEPLRRLKNPELSHEEKTAEWHQVKVLGLSRYILTVYVVSNVTFTIRILYAVIANMVFHKFLSEHDSQINATIERMGLASRTPSSRGGNYAALSSARILRTALVDSFLLHLNNVFLPQLVEKCKEVTFDLVDNQSSIGETQFQDLVDKIRSRLEPSMNGSDGDRSLNPGYIGGRIDVRRALEMLEANEATHKIDVNTVHTLARKALECHSDCIESPEAGLIWKEMADECFHLAGNLCSTKLFGTTSNGSDSENTPTNTKELGIICFELRSVSNILLGSDSDTSSNQMTRAVFYNRSIASLCDKIQRYEDLGWIVE